MESVALQNDKPRLLIVSHVLPLPGATGQQQRVANTLRTFRNHFHVSFLTSCGKQPEQVLRQKLVEFCDEAILLPSAYEASQFGKLWHRGAGAAYALRTGLKESNYIIGELEFAAERIEMALDGRSFDLALFEYWHAAGAVEIFKRRGIPCALDMHDVLWQTYKRQLDRGALPASLKSWQLERYRQREEQAWQLFDAIIAINHSELQHVAQCVPPPVKLFHAGMGVDLTMWPYLWQPQNPPRLAYYGGLGNPHNQTDARKVHDELMPALWRRFPDAELWLIGSNPPEDLRALTADARVKVTGFIERVQPILSTMTAVLCPFSGTFGFRSRVIETMALGVPVVASPDAVYGMEMEEGRGLLLGETNEQLIEHALRLLDDQSFAAEQSKLARRQIETQFSVEATYGKLALELRDWLLNSEASFTRISH